eukprot:1160261-Pelagomonas_calceolata.AAC.20
MDSMGCAVGCGTSPLPLSGKRTPSCMSCSYTSHELHFTRASHTSPVHMLSMPYELRLPCVSHIVCYTLIRPWRFLCLRQAALKRQTSVFKLMHKYSFCAAQAARERLITISLSVAESTVNNVVEQISNLYKSGE